MRFAEDSSPTHSIQSCSEDGIVIDDKRIIHSVVISPDTVQAWPPTCVEALTTEHLEQLHALEPEVVIIGTGQALKFPPPELTVGLQHAGIGVEIMANDAACRTFNVLLSEDRRVVLALMLG
jgi:uncharacterized protein